MGANQSSPVDHMDSERIGRPGYNRNSSNHDIRSAELTKKMRLDDLLQYTSPEHTGSHVQLASRIDRVASLPPAPLTSLQRMATTKVNRERSPVKVIPTSPSIEELSDSPAVMPLIKRRSLLYAITPGLSTRAPRIEIEPMPELVDVDESSENSLLSHNENNTNQIILEILRTATPAVTDLALGSFRQGTLRIVNGAPSPVATPMLPSQEFNESVGPQYCINNLLAQKTKHTETQPTARRISGRMKESRDGPRSDSKRVRSTSTQLEADFKAFLDGQSLHDCKTEEQKQVLERVSSMKRRSRPQSCASLDLVDQVEVLRVVSKRSSMDKCKEEPGVRSNDQTIVGQAVRDWPCVLTTTHNPDFDKLKAITFSQDTSSHHSGSVKPTSVRSVSLESTNSSQDDATTASSNLERVSSLSSLESYQSYKALQQPFIPAMAEMLPPPVRSAFVDVEGRAPFHVHRGKPKKLEDMLRISSGPNANQSMISPSSASWHISDSSVSTTSSRRGKNVPLNYVPFEPISAGSKESKVKFYRPPSHFSQAQKEESPEFGMRIQTASTKISKVLSRGPSESTACQRTLPRGPRPMFDRALSSDSGFDLPSHIDAHEVVVENQTGRQPQESGFSKSNTRNLTPTVILF